MVVVKVMASLEWQGPQVAGWLPLFMVVSHGGHMLGQGRSMTLLAPVHRVVAMVAWVAAGLANP